MTLNQSPTTVSSCKITVLLVNPGQAEKKLGSIEFVSDYLLALGMARTSGADFLALFHKLRNGPFILSNLM
jgi:hypothetical protein